ncbi:hypothetical protein Leryth_017367 [Lithospermum erythrorhizon]|nr:hypothetical protein Leryth_017367 [Lithospermum erythrorhizon]
MEDYYAHSKRWCQMSSTLALLMSDRLWWPKEMENHDVILAQNHSIMVGQNQQVIISHSHNLGSIQTKRSELEENHDGLGLTADHDDEMNLHGKGSDNVEVNGDQELAHEVEQIHGNEDQDLILHEENDNIDASDEDPIVCISLFEK